MNSQLIKRVSLETHDPKFMPPSGEPLSYYEARLIAWWIEHGASDEKGIPDEVPKDLLSWLASRYKLDLSEQPYVQLMGPKLELNTEAISALRREKWRVQPLAADNNLLEVIAPESSLTKKQWEALKMAASEITWLKLQGIEGGLAPLADIKSWPHLTRADLSGQTVTKEVLEAFTQAPNLEVLVLRGTDFLDPAIEPISKSSRSSGFTFGTAISLKPLWKN